MWIAFTGLAGRILQSPAHHQLHHSANPIHYNRNLGFALALWDWAFGTLAVPTRARERIAFGVGAEAPPFRSALAAFVIPCARFGGHIGGFATARRRRATAEVARS
jgi:sterol desaturase/sphingolipid hydroxylase (fatty acid hydroxylase superfamily)